MKRDVPILLPALLLALAHLGTPAGARAAGVDLEEAPDGAGC